MLCAMVGGDIGGQKLGVTSCLALIGTVEVNAFTVIEMRTQAHCRIR